VQPLLPGLEATAPDGLVYRPGFLTTAEERALLERVAALELGDFRMHGVVARRRVAYFGHDYSADRREITRVETEVPPWLTALRARCAALAGEPPERLEQVLVAMYPPGAGVGWHRDAPQFGVVVGVSLGTACRMRFRTEPAGRRPGPRGPGAGRTARSAGDGRGASYEAWLEPGSAYVLAGAARWAWQHAIPPVRTLRFSITFRTVRPARRAAP
jgi:alkylated DNA repair dioxygenase AlkB